MQNASLCEACQLAAVEVEFHELHEKRPYRLCNPCLARLETYALRPLEWFNLAAVHGGRSYHLHDDFYDEDGTALQPEVAVEGVDKFPARTLADVGDDLPRLIDYCMTRWSIEDEAREALCRFSEKEVLNELIRRADDDSNQYTKATCFGICAIAIGATGAEWVRNEAAHIEPRQIWSWAQAAAACLRLEEAFRLATGILENCHPRDLANSALALGDFRTTLTLNWIENKLPASGLPVIDSWGRLAAVSLLSWQRVQKWLRAGRPLSLAALDALNACWHYDTPYLRKIQPKLAEPASIAEASRELQEYLVRDSVHRVKRTIPIILEHWAEIVTTPSTRHPPSSYGR